MVLIEIIRDYKCCWKAGQRREVMDHFAAVLVELGYAKYVNEKDNSHTESKELNQ